MWHNHIFSQRSKTTKRPVEDVLEKKWKRGGGKQQMGVGNLCI